MDKEEEEGEVGREGGRAGREKRRRGRWEEREEGIGEGDGQDRISYF